MNEWISCSERLPQPDEHVIMYCRTEHKPDWHIEPGLFEMQDKYDEEYPYKSPSWAYLFAYNEGYDYALEVSHWMELPEKPHE